MWKHTRTALRRQTSQVTGTVSCRVPPITVMSPPGLTMAMAALIHAEAPLASNTISAPTPPVMDNTWATASSLSVSIRVVAPNCSAAGKPRAVSWVRPHRIICFAPQARAAATPSRPTCPAPMTTAVSMACCSIGIPKLPSTIEKGSKIAA